MARIFLDQKLLVGATARLDPETSHRLQRVLRVKPGDAITVFNGMGGEFEARMSAVRGGVLEIQIGGRLDVDRESPLAVSLVQGISRGERMDYTIQKAVELGVKTIYPVYTERTVVRLSTDRAARRYDHWRGVVRHACEQSGRTAIAGLAEPQQLNDLLTQPWMRGSILLDTQSSRTLHAIDKPDGPFAVIAGPEGGFSDQERHVLREAGALSVRIGPRTLRTETAALTTLSILQAQWGDL